MSWIFLMDVPCVFCVVESELLNFLDELHVSKT